jgi:hypothetical protein
MGEEEEEEEREGTYGSISAVSCESRIPCVSTPAPNEMVGKAGTPLRVLVSFAAALAALAAAAAGVEWSVAVSAGTMLHLQCGIVREVGGRGWVRGWVRVRVR